MPLATHSAMVLSMEAVRSLTAEAKSSGNKGENAAIRPRSAAWNPTAWLIVWAAS